MTYHETSSTPTINTRTSKRTVPFIRGSRGRWLSAIVRMNALVSFSGMTFSGATILPLAGIFCPARGVVVWQAVSLNGLKMDEKGFSSRKFCAKPWALSTKRIDAERKRRSSEFTDNRWRRVKRLNVEDARNVSKSHKKSDACSFKIANSQDKKTGWQQSHRFCFSAWFGEKPCRIQTFPTSHWMIGCGDDDRHETIKISQKRAQRKINTKAFHLRALVFLQRSRRRSLAGSVCYEQLKNSTNSWNLWNSSAAQILKMTLNFIKPWCKYKHYRQKMQSTTTSRRERALTALKHFS